MHYDGPERRVGTSDMMTMLARIEERQIAMLNKMEEHIILDEKRFERMEKDLNVLSRNMWLATGGGVVIVWAIAIFVK